MRRHVDHQDVRFAIPLRAYFGLTLAISWGAELPPMPFTREQFVDVFAAYNTALWPGAVALWIASVLICALMLRASGRSAGRVISALLAIHWAWSGLAYHVTFFTRINPAAWLFAAMFLVQAGLLLWTAVVKGRLRFTTTHSAWTFVAQAFIAYALVYPAINAAQHLSVSRIPTFGVPCPTTIFTAGLLMIGNPHLWRLSAIPIIWSAIAGSAAFSLGVHADYALPVAAVALVASSFRQSGIPNEDREETGHDDDRSKSLRPARRKRSS